MPPLWLPIVFRDVRSQAYTYMNGQMNAYLYENQVLLIQLILIPNGFCKVVIWIFFFTSEDEQWKLDFSVVRIFQIDRLSWKNTLRYMVIEITIDEIER